MIDCGLDWADKVWEIAPDVIFITHAHPDHAFGLQGGSPCPVYATTDSWQIMRNFGIPEHDRHVVVAREPVSFGRLHIEAFMVVHSIRAPAVGYRITAGPYVFFCVHDIVYIQDREKALQGAFLYIGDGASPVRPLVRKKGDAIFGHSSMSTQLTWCEKMGVPQAIFTHCGTQVVQAPNSIVSQQVETLARERGVHACIAYDGMMIRLTPEGYVIL
jgi:phosphoribosyl 1,2-cyclic phosphodiesterase